MPPSKAKSKPHGPKAAGTNRKAGRRRGQGRPSATVAVGQAAVIAATRTVLGTTPPHALTFNQVATAAGVDQRLIRYYFGQLPDLLRAVALDITSELRENFKDLAARELTPRDRVRERVAVFLKLFGKSPHYHRVFVDFLLASNGGPNDAVIDGIKRSIGELEGALRECRKAAGLKDLDGRFAHVMTASLCEFFFSARPVFVTLFGEDAKSEAFQKRYADAVTDLLIGPDTKK